MTSLLTDINPNLLQVGPGESCTLAVRITNPTSLIDAYQVSIFGLDPNWVSTSPNRLSLFPGEAGDVEVTISLPVAFPAGHRQLSVHIRSENEKYLTAQGNPSEHMPHPEVGKTWHPGDDWTKWEGIIMPGLQPDQPFTKEYTGDFKGMFKSAGGRYRRGVRAWGQIAQREEAFT